MVLAVLPGCGQQATPAAQESIRLPSSTLTVTATPFQPSTRTPNPTATPPGPPPVIILFIGDGMGEGHRAAARWQSAGPGGQLVMDSLPAQGWARTQTSDGATTDSAAAATAMATGQKTLYETLGQDAAGNDLLTILEQAEALGLSTGLVTNTKITDATPAAFAVSVFNREWTTTITGQLLEADIEVLLGGGEDDFLPETQTGCYPGNGNRTKDQRNLIGEAIDDHYTYICSARELEALDLDTTGHLLGLFGDEGMARPFKPALPEMTQAALDLLSRDPDGFFLMVEAGQIDWAAHDNDAANVISDVLELDQSVALAKDFADRRGNVLLIVTADHETGGMSLDLESGKGPFVMPDGTRFYVQWFSESHTDADVPVSAQGPCAAQLEGIYENTHIHDVMAQALAGSCPVEPAD